MSSLAILTDTTKCIGCRECVLACKKRYGLEEDFPRHWSQKDGLSAENWTSIVERPGNRFVRKQCRHCLEPACVASCPVGALSRTSEGAVVYDREKCIGCRYCMMAVPTESPDMNGTVGFPTSGNANFAPITSPAAGSRLARNPIPPAQRFSANVTNYCTRLTAALHPSRANT